MTISYLTKISIRSILPISLFLVLSFSSCNTKKPEILWSFSKEDVTGANKTQSENLSVDIYLDGTTSMLGFNSPASTNYSKLLEDIELVVGNVWKKTDVKYFKFTTQIDTLNRQQFIEGKNNPKFYVDRFTKNQLNIDNAVSNIDPKRVSIIITDLFYKGQDINKVVRALNENCIQKGIDIGVLSVTSTFTGTVADVDPAVDIKNENRPLYVLIFGDKGNIDRVFGAFSTKPYVNASQKFIISRLPLISYTVNVEKKKDKNNSSINSDQGSVNKYKEKGFDNVFGFRLKEKGDAYLTFELTPQIHSAFAGYSSSDIRLTAFKKIGELKDSVSTEEVTLENVKVQKDKIIGELKISTEEEEEAFSYLINIGFDNTKPLSMPKWIKDYDTDLYNSDSPKDKTIYLSKLFTEVTTYNTTYNNPKLGKFYIYIRR